MKLINALIVMMLLIPIVCASDLYYSEKDNIDIKVPCRNNNAPCSAAATCNLTVIYPNGSLVVNNKQMTNQIVFHNYTIGKTELGEYDALIDCRDLTFNGTSAFTFKVNFNGENNDRIYVWLSGLAVLLAFSVALTIYFFSSDSMFATLFLTLSFLLFTLNAYAGWQISKDFGAIIEKIMFGTYLLALIIFLFIFLIVLVAWTLQGYEWIVNKRSTELGKNDNLVK